MENDKIVEVMYKLGSIEAMLKALAEKIDQHISDTKSVHADHEQRITNLERKGIKQTAVAGTIGAVGAFLFEAFKWVTHN